MSAGFYPNVLFEAAHNASIIPLASEPTYFAMVGFGGYNLPLAFVLAVIGATAGQLFNWFLGRLLFKAKQANIVPFKENTYQRAASTFNKYVVFALLFSWMPMFGFVTIAAGFLGTRLRIALPLLIVGIAGHYGWYLI